MTNSEKDRLADIERSSASGDPESTRQSTDPTAAGHGLGPGRVVPVVAALVAAVVLVAGLVAG